ncbi:MAG: hypothetical protein Q7T55_15665 [Solirubrobacteraceae bacterium]|nr:hypothetical protein [Solirubrobacteraceae bacterium]
MSASIGLGVLAVAGCDSVDVAPKEPADLARAISACEAQTPYLGWD